MASASLDHLPAYVPQVPVEPLLARHRDKYGKGREETCVHQFSNGDNLCGGIFLGGQNRRGLVRYGGWVDSDEDRTEEDSGLFVWVWSETEWASMRNAELTAENRSTYKDRLDGERERTTRGSRKSR